MSIEVKCQTCGKLFKVKPYRADTAKYCSHKCRQKQVEIKCEYCGKKFQLVANRAEKAKFCSPECFQKSGGPRDKKVTSTCQTCGKIFKIKPSVLEKGHGKFCSLECRYPPKIETKCLQCGKIFKTHPFRIRDGIKFCSKKCHNKSLEQKVTITCEICGKIIISQPAIIKRGRRFCSLQCFAKSREDQVDRICKNCGKYFKVRIGIIKSGQGKFCSKKCQNEYSIGEHASGWKGGISFEPYCSKFNEKFKERVRNFWKRKCGICNKRESEENMRLHVHHVNYEKMVCCNDTPPLFIPLCHSCHSKTNSNRIGWEFNLTEYIMIYFDGESYLKK